MTWHVRWSRQATKQLLSIEKRQRLMIASWAKEHLENCSNPKAVSGVKKLAGTKAGWRYRVGSYRLICHLDDGSLVVEVIRVGHRQGVYDNLPEL